MLDDPSCPTGCKLPATPASSDSAQSIVTGTVVALAVGESTTSLYTCKTDYTGTLTLTCPEAGKVAGVAGVCNKGEWSREDKLLCDHCSTDLLVPCADCNLGSPSFFPGAASTLAGVVISASTMKVRHGSSAVEGLRCDTARNFTSGTVVSAVCTNGDLYVSHTCGTPGGWVAH